MPTNEDLRDQLNAIALRLVALEKRCDERDVEEAREAALLKSSVSELLHALNQKLFG